MFQRKNNRLAIRSLVVIALCSILFSFSTELGGSDSFEIYLNNTLVLRQFVSRDVEVKNLPLNESAADDAMKVHYSHCGQIGKARSLSIRDSKNTILKVWYFPDTDAVAQGMTCRVKDILALQKSSQTNVLDLYYSSKELPEGRKLAALVISDDKASLR